MAAVGLSAQDLEISYLDRSGSRRRLIEAFNLDAGPGDFVCLAGRSGSGKTSILRCLVGLQVASAGTVSWDGMATVDMSPDQLADLRRKRLTYVDQAASMVQELSLQDNLVLPFVPDGHAAIAVGAARTQEILSRLGLGELQRARPKHLSGGERQRAAIARALAVPDSAIIADEPTASLDRGWADVVIKELRKCADDGRMVIVASHDPGVAASADHVSVLEP